MIGIEQTADNIFRDLEQLFAAGEVQWPRFLN